MSPTATFRLAGVKLLSATATLSPPPAGAWAAGSSLEPPQAAMPIAAAAKQTERMRLTMPSKTLAAAAYSVEVVWRLTS